MGYCTYFTDITPMADIHLEKLEEICGFKPDFEDSMKWYDYQEHMAKLSTFFPTMLFELHGSGEEDDDLWKAYWKNGAMQHCMVKMFYDPFDEGFMKQLVEPIPPRPDYEGQFKVDQANAVDWDF